MNTLTWILLIAAIVIFIAGMFFPKKSDEKIIAKDDCKNIVQKMENIDNLKVTSYKIIIPLRIQACERLLLFLERIQLPVLVKREFLPGNSRDDFQFSMVQNVQDEFEHNLAQRLYVTENTWNLVNLAKEDVLKDINTVFSENPDSDAATVAAILGSLQNRLVEEAIKNVKREFDTFSV